MKSHRLFVLALTLLCCQGATSQARIKNALIVESQLAKSESVNPFAFQEELKEKSVWMAVAYSLALPGMGELYAGSFSTGKYFLMADAGLWLTYGAFISHGNWLRNDARAFAQQHAHVLLNGKDDQFEVNIGNFENVEQYNQQKLRNREYSLLYTAPEYSWQWDSEAYREQFKSLRIRSDEIYRNANFLIGAAVVNRVISAFMAGRAAAAHNRRVLYEGAWQLRVLPLGGLLATHGIELKVSKEF